MPLKLRWKILITLMIIGSVPLLIYAWLDARSLRELGSSLAEEGGRALNELTRTNVEQLADNFVYLVNRERQVIELLARLHARAAENALAQSHGNDAVHWHDEFRTGNEALGMLSVPNRFDTLEADGERAPLPFSLTHQSFFAAANGAGDALRAQAARLNTLTSYYRDVERHHSDIVFRQYVVLKDGLMGIYPGHGGFAEGFRPQSLGDYAAQENAGHFRWSQPRADSFTGRMIVSATMPLYYDDGRFAGVSGLDIATNQFLSRMTLSNEVEKASSVLFTVLDEESTSREPRIVIRAERSAIDIEIGETLKFDEQTTTDVLVEDMRRGRRGFRSATLRGQAVYCLYRPFTDAAGYFFFIVPRAALVDGAMRLAQETLNNTKRYIAKLIPTLCALVAMIGVVAFFSSRAITTPVNQLADAAHRVAEGDFDTRVDINSGDELQRLGEAFNAMVPQLAERTRVNASLDFASDVQRQLMPEHISSVHGIDIAGISLYSEQTGGDYYDYLPLGGADSGRFGIAIGDVSGHGIGSALVMATLRGHLHSATDFAQSPAEILQHINEKISDDMHAGQFITLFYLNLDIAARTAQWSSAGHDAAIRFNRSSGQFSELGGDDIPLGIDNTWCYETTNTATLSEDDWIVLATDGVWETRNPHGEFFGKARLRDIIRNNQMASADEICQMIIAELARFRGDPTQRDDVTALVFRLNDSNGKT